MKIILILMLCGLVVSIGFLVAFFWAVNDGQYEDSQTPAMRILFEDEVKENKTETNESN